MLTVSLGDFDNRDIECATTQIVNSDRGVTCLLIHTVGQCRCSRLIDNSLNFQTGNLACILGRLTLGIVEVGRHGNHCLSD